VESAFPVTRRANRNRGPKWLIGQTDQSDIVWRRGTFGRSGMNEHALELVVQINFVAATPLQLFGVERFTECLLATDFRLARLERLQQVILKEPAQPSASSLVRALSRRLEPRGPASRRRRAERERRTLFDPPRATQGGPRQGQRPKRRPSFWANDNMWASTTSSAAATSSSLRL
jgi:hypothetical protein